MKVFAFPILTDTLVQNQRIFSWKAHIFMYCIFYILRTCFNLPIVWNIKQMKLAFVHYTIYEGSMLFQYAVILRSQSHTSVPVFNPLNAQLNPICHLMALLGAHH
jgi:hypothetical protein